MHLCGPSISPLTPPPPTPQKHGIWLSCLGQAPSWPYTIAVMEKSNRVSAPQLCVLPVPVSQARHWREGEGESEAPTPVPIASMGGGEAHNRGLPPFLLPCGPTQLWLLRSGEH